MLTGSVTLQNASLTSTDSLPSLWRTLRLVSEIEELAESNKLLRETWRERRSSVYTLVKKSLTTSIRACAEVFVLAGAIR